MRDLHIYLTNPFDDPKISMSELLAFTSDHVQRMSSSNPAMFAARITATIAALAGVNAAFTDDETQLAVRKAGKAVKAGYRASLPQNVGKIAVTVENQFGEKSPQFIRCFPHGRTVFSNCTDEKLGDELQTLINGVTALQPPLAAQTVTDASALLTGWDAVRTPSETATGVKTTTVAAKHAARAALQWELFLNLQAISQNFPRQPGMLDTYMQQSLLQPHTQSPAAPSAGA